MKPSKDPESIKRAVQEMDRLAGMSEGSGWMGDEEVVGWRRRRYSYLTQA